MIFVHGCFWHRHDCHLFVWPKTRIEFWETKLNRNYERDAEQQAALLDEGWRVAVVWECALKGSKKLEELELGTELASWIERSDLTKLEIYGFK